MNTRHHLPCAEWAEAIAAANDAFNSANTGARVVAGDFPETSPKGGLLIFLKPEVSQLLRPAVETIVEHLLTSAFEHGIEISGAAVLSGRHLLRSRFLQRNYRSIHDHAQASSLIGSSSIPFQSKGNDIGENASGVDTILGGLVATKRMITADNLQTAWSAERDRIVKLEDDCYALPLSLAGRRHLILNGFYPKQLRTYAEVGSRIIAFACHTDALLPALKRNFQGDADPRICEPGSMRWNLHRNMREYGIREFNTSTNGIHMSASAADGERELELMIECTTGLHVASSVSGASEDRSMQSNVRARLRGLHRFPPTGDTPREQTT
jgi:hypothetical protein